MTLMLYICGGDPGRDPRAEAVTSRLFAGSADATVKQPGRNSDQLFSLLVHYECRKAEKK